MADANAGGVFAPPKDFFISYTAVDWGWAEWIGWCLEDEGYIVDFDKWDCRPGHNFVLFMQRATSAKRTIVVLSNALLEASYPQPEWAAAFANDPEGIGRKLIPVRIGHCSPEGLLRSVKYVDLVEVDEKEAVRRLLDGVREGRAKPNTRPSFPGLQITTRCPTCGRVE